MRTQMSTPSELGAMVLLSRLSRSIHRAAKEDKLGMTFKQYATLASLRVPGSVSQQDLCISMHLDANNCVLLLNDLESSGYVRRTRDPADRRRHIVEITSQGRVALAGAEDALNGVEDQVLGSLDAEERETLRTLLARALAGDPAEQAVPTA
jgi:MarR family transcriptional regulator, temperature-dependent positive regulator of motility